MRTSCRRVRSEHHKTPEPPTWLIFSPSGVGRHRPPSRSRCCRSRRPRTRRAATAGRPPARKKKTHAVAAANSTCGVASCITARRTAILAATPTRCHTLCAAITLLGAKQSTADASEHSSTAFNVAAARGRLAVGSDIDTYCAVSGASAATSNAGSAAAHQGAAQLALTAAVADEVGLVKQAAAPARRVL